MLLGLVLLYYGGGALVSGASSLAARLGISVLIIGLTVVAFGTSAPELAATLSASLRGSNDMAVGNIVGSNVANVGLILGLGAAFLAIPASRGMLRSEIPLMLMSMGLMAALLWLGGLSRLDGLLLFALLLGYLAWQFMQSRRGTAVAAVAEAEEVADHRRPALHSIGLIVLGLALLVAGAQALVTGATDIARGFGVPERVIGLTLVAVGTSLPELATTIVTVLRRETELLVGNIVGSNVFNSLGILGVAAMVTPLPASVGGELDLLVMMGFGLLLWLLMARGVLPRWGGGVLLLAYAAYTASLFVG